MANALVYVELVEGKATRKSLLALNCGRRIATRLGATLYAIVPCAQASRDTSDDAVVTTLSRHGADKVVWITNPQLDTPALYLTHGQAIRTACDQFPPQLVLFPASSGGHDIGARLALDLDGYFAGDVALEIPAQGAPIRFSRQIFRGGLREVQELTGANRPLVLVLTPEERPPEELGIDEAEVIFLQAPTNDRSHLKILDDDGASEAPRTSNEIGDADRSEN